MLEAGLCSETGDEWTILLTYKNAKTITKSEDAPKDVLCVCVLDLGVGDNYNPQQAAVLLEWAAVEPIQTTVLSTVISDLHNRQATTQPRTAQAHTKQQTRALREVGHMHSFAEQGIITQRLCLESLTVLVSMAIHRKTKSC